MRGSAPDGSVLHKEVDEKEEIFGIGVCCRRVLSLTERIIQSSEEKTHERSKRKRRADERARRIRVVFAAGNGGSTR
jgi:hypothetical protein